MNKKIQQLLTELTLEEKAGLCSGLDFWHTKGVERLDIPSVMVTDGPHGLRKQDGESDHIGLNKSVPATCFPTASTLASSWDEELLYEVGQALGEECRQEKVAVLLGPGTNIKRSPLCGRNFEYFSEDPYLSGRMATKHIQGVQSEGIGTSLKHYAVNNQETRRMLINTIVDERALREIYLPSFEMAVKEAQPDTVMCAYNQLRGEFCSQNVILLTSILKEEWGYKGFVVTDWGATVDRVKGLTAGLDLEMPGSGGINDKKIVAAVEQDELDMTVLDEAVRRILSVVLSKTKTLEAPYSYDKEAHHTLARRAAIEGSVLLKNEGSLLPLGKPKKIAVVGTFAKTPRYQGAGSSLINPSRIDTALEALKNALPDSELLYAPGYNPDDDLINQTLIAQAVKAAETADVSLIFAGLTEEYESEGFDRTHMRMPESHNTLIKAVAEANPKTVVILSNGAPVEMDWLGQVPAVLESYLGGQASGSAVISLLLGENNPSGKLTETFPLRLEDNPTAPNFPAGPQSVEYRESIYVGYRYFDTSHKEVLFPFGHGLSYTSFEYGELKLSSEKIGVTDELKLSLTVQNVGNQPGKEVVQLYVRDMESTIFRPDKELKAFKKISLEVGESKTIEFTLSKRAFAYYDVYQKDWIVESGEFELLVGASSRDIRQTGTLYVESRDKISSEILAMSQRHSSYYKPDVANWYGDAGSFTELYGTPLPSNEPTKPGSFTLNSSLSDVSVTKLGKMIHAGVTKRVLKMLGDDSPKNQRFAKALVGEMPLRGLVMMSQGEFGENLINALLLMMNGKFIGGLRMILKDKFTGKR